MDIDTIILQCLCHCSSRESKSKLWSDLYVRHTTFLLTLAVQCCYKSRLTHHFFKTDLAKLKQHLISVSGARYIYSPWCYSKTQTATFVVLKIYEKFDTWSTQTQLLSRLTLKWKWWWYSACRISQMRYWLHIIDPGGRGVQATYIGHWIWYLPKIPPRGRRGFESRTRPNIYRLPHGKSTYRLNFLKLSCDPGSRGFQATYISLNLGPPRERAKES